MTRTNNKGLLVLSYIVASLPSAKAAELKSETAAAFNRYVNGAEARMAEDLRQGHFLVVDDLPESARQQAYMQLSKAGYLSSRCARKETGTPFPFRAASSTIGSG